MSLYKHLAPLYDEIFPLSESSIQTIQHIAQKKLPSQKHVTLLDLGCATGSLIAALEKRGWETYGIELEPAMADYAKGNVVIGSMLDAPSLFPQKQFNVITCLGNTIPHLTPELRSSLLESSYALLTSPGLFIVQLVNYAHPSIHAGFVFPEVKTHHCTFSRRYEPGPTPDSLLFSTSLSLDTNTYTDTTVLYPITISELTREASRHGFSLYAIYAGWDQTPFSPQDSLYCICVLYK